MKVIKIESIKRTKNRLAEVLQLYKEDKELDALPKWRSWFWLWIRELGWTMLKITKMRNISQIMNWRLYKANFLKNTMWDFSYQKTWLNIEKKFDPMYCPWFKIHKPWLEKIYIFCIIEADLGEIGLRHKNKFDQRVSFFNYLRQRAQCGTIIHNGIIQYLLILYPDDLKISKK